MEGFGQELASPTQTDSKRASILQELNSPKATKNTAPFLKAPEPPARSITPEPVLESMHERLPEEPTTKGFDGLVPGDVPVQAMHNRVDSGVTGVS